MRKRRKVVQNDLDLIAFPHMEQGRWHLPAEGKGLERLLADERDTRLFDVHFELVVRRSGLRFRMLCWFTGIRGGRRRRQRRNCNCCPQTRQHGIPSRNVRHHTFL
ncbi:hypothetical protein EBBID32_13470 [Sphingobium indicum BiD32]|uniref:Uncharacterized protein n=1 Tax=Sphingobium indicum BiD32 TaxID=1301087 RepID=N1MNE8_9SPHN|nr:hypothetical protein EBBID32_13470 [Sphingobium indicum BiD32]